jgi:hypothetical protein
MPFPPQLGAPPDPISPFDSVPALVVADIQVPASLALFAAHAPPSLSLLESAFTWNMSVNPVESALPKRKT